MKEKEDHPLTLAPCNYQPGVDLAMSGDNRIVNVRIRSLVHGVFLMKMIWQAKAGMSTATEQLLGCSVALQILLLRIMAGIHAASCCHLSICELSTINTKLTFSILQPEMSSLEHLLISTPANKPEKAAGLRCYW